MPGLDGIEVTRQGMDFYADNFDYPYPFGKYDQLFVPEFNAGAMELGQTVCVARTPQCEACPIAELCAWRAAGYPAYEGPTAPRQARFEGSDRHVRGLRQARARGLRRVAGEVGLDFLHPPNSAMILSVCWCRAYLLTE